MVMKNKDKLRHVSHTNEWLEHIYETIIQKDEKEYAFVEMNIKQFRYINIEYGCAFGDHVLVSMQQLLETQLKGRGYVDTGTSVISEFYTPLVPKGHDFLKEIGRLSKSRQDGQAACEAKAAGTD